MQKSLEDKSPICSLERTLYQLEKCQLYLLNTVRVLQCWTSQFDWWPINFPSFSIKFFIHMLLGNELAGSSCYLYV